MDTLNRPVAGAVPEHPAPGKMEHAAVQCVDEETADTCKTERKTFIALGVRDPSLTRAKSLTPTAPAVITFDNTKAGLQSVDKTKTEAIIAEMSEGSNYYLNEERKLKNRQKKVEALEEKKKKFASWERNCPMASAKMRQSVDALESSMESERYTHRIFAHLDMDMFYAAVEEKKNPELKKFPIGVGSMSMLSTTNYVARQYGVRAGMAGFIGKKLCPELILVPLDFKRYKLEAEGVRAITAAYDPHFSALGWDELTMELTPYVHAHFPEAETMEAKYRAAEAAMEECRRLICESTGLTASVGIGPTTSLAKMASNYNKPNGQYCLPFTSGEAIRAYLRDQNVRSIQGIGKSTEFLLNGIGIHTLGEVYDSRYLLCYLLTPKTFAFLFASCIGSVRHSFSDYDRHSDSIGHSEKNEDGQEEIKDSGRESAAARDEKSVETEPPQKSIGAESTFSPLSSKTELEEIARQHLSHSYVFIQEHALLVGQVVLKVKYRSFQLHYFSQNIDPPTDSEKVLQHVLDKLLASQLAQFDNVRLLGVRLEKLSTRRKQPEDGVGVGNSTSVPRTLSDFLKRAREETKRKSAPHSCDVESCRARRRARKELTRLPVRSSSVVYDDQDVVVCLSSTEEERNSHAEEGGGDQGGSFGVPFISSERAESTREREGSLVLVSSTSSASSGFRCNSVSTESSLCSMSPSRVETEFEECVELSRKGGGSFHKEGVTNAEKTVDPCSILSVGLKRLSEPDYGAESFPLSAGVEAIPQHEDPYMVVPDSFTDASRSSSVEVVVNSALIDPSPIVVDDVESEN